MSEPLWSLEVEQTVPGTYLADEKLLAATLQGGLSPVTVREVIAQSLGSAPLTLELIRPDGKSLYETAIPVGDILLFNWMPVFSESAYDLLLSQGCSDAEFLDCRFRVLGSRSFKAHIPLLNYDVIDFPCSIAMHSIPLEPPIPFHFVSVKLKPTSTKLPPCFRVPAPGHPQVLGELFALESFRAAWQSSGLQGARFRPLAHGAP